MAVRILVDSTFDFTDEQLALTGIEVVRLHVNFGGEELVDGVDITPEGFYERLIESSELPTTSQAAPADFAVNLPRAPLRAAIIIFHAAASGKRRIFQVSLFHIQKQK